MVIRTTQQRDWYAPNALHTTAYERHLIVPLINSTLTDVVAKVVDPTANPERHNALCLVRVPRPLFAAWLAHLIGGFGGVQEVLGPQLQAAIGPLDRLERIGALGG